MKLKILSKKRSLLSCGLNLTVISSVLLMFFVAACSDTAELTPIQKSLYSAWKMADKIRAAYRTKKADPIVSMVSPNLAQQWSLQKKLNELFLGMAQTSLHLELDSGVWDADTGTVIYKAHWTFTGVISLGGPKFFKTGECRLWIRLGENGAPSTIERVVGDNFFLISLPKQKIPVNGGT
ncbi:MAG: hypothetical protein ACYCRD_02150 [Leptospirillum sp.]